MVLFRLKKIHLAWLGVILLYLVTHLYRLTALPVFADEAIYLRWSQLVLDDWQRYAFFPLNDGKTPLQIWMNVPALVTFSDPLWAGRFIAVMAGLAQLFFTTKLIKQLGGKAAAQLIGAVLITITPYWFFHHRMAILDAWMVVWITAVYWMAITIVQLPKPHLTPSHKQLRVIGMMGGFLGLALWTKVPAVLIAPALIFLPLLPEKRSWKERGYLLVHLVGGLAIGVLLFGLLKLNPAFGQLFSRGSDFLYPASEVLFGPKWKDTLPNLPTYLWYFIIYLTPPVLALNLYALFSPTQKRQQWMLVVGAAAFFGPIALLGRVVYPRYLFPTALFMTVSAALALEEITLLIQQFKRFWLQALTALVLAVVVTNIVAASSVFMVTHLTEPNQTPFVAADRTQYLEDWSSGHGIVEAVSFINEMRAHESVAVATEGYFGTLPDAVLLYYHGRDVDNLYVEGIGQPVHVIPDAFIQRAQSFDRQLLLVNSHRYKLHLPETALLAEFCRPNSAPCLQIWDIQSLVKDTDT